MAYNKKAQKKYAEKTMSFALKYTPTDIQEGNRLKAYLTSSGISCNAYLKELVRKDLDKKEIGYNTPAQITEKL